jgi:hypothetical protein
MCWPIKWAASEGIFVSTYDTFYSFNFWLEKVSIQCKAVRNSVSIRVTPSKAVQGEVLVSIVILENATDASYCLKILVTLLVPVMERIWICGITI